jgi:hypothetical protein
MEIGPLKFEQTLADTLRLIKEGFMVVTVEGAERVSVWNFLFETVRESDCFEKSMDEIAILSPDGRVADDVIEDIALNYKTVRYSLISATEATK